MSTSLRPAPGPAEVIRRTVAVLLGAATLTAAVYGNGTTTCLRTLDHWAAYSSDAGCATTYSRPVGFWVVLGGLGLLAFVLWSAPWQKWTRERRRTHSPRISFRLRRRWRKIAGVSLIGLGLGAVLSSIAGMYSHSLSCAWYELWCRTPTNEGFFRLENLMLLPNHAIRPFDGPERLVGVGFGVAAIWWGVVELRPTRPQGRPLSTSGIGRVGVIGVIVAVAPEFLGLGWPGFGLLQIAGVFGSLLLITAAFVASTPRRRPRVMNQDHLFAAMALTFALGAWVAVLRSPWLVSPVPFAAAGLYISYVRWTNRKQRTAELLEEERFVAWTHQSPSGEVRTADS